MREPRAAVLPRAPSELERERHALTHLPFAPWCPACVQGRGRDDGHRQVSLRGLPLVQWDYSFLRSADPEDRLVPILLGYVMGTGYGYAGAALGKGVTANKELVRDAMSFLSEIGLTGDLRLRSDGEPAIVAVLKAIAAAR
eukprot:16446627-Heterocapsa_arctica.AAC.1